jgi:hypothetical protein
MGADLIGYMVIGPMEISDETKRKAIDQLEQLKAKAAKQCEIYEAAAEVGKEEAFDWDIMEEFGIDIDDGFFDDWELFFDSIESLKPESFVEEIIDFWNSGSRDSASRIIEKDGKLLRIAFAGDMSWGDEPSGWGYECLRDAHKYNIAHILGWE